MSLTTPKSETRAEPWAVRFMAHVLFGVLAWNSLVWVVSPIDAVWIVALAYGVLWEVLAQGVGAGWRDAVTDTWAVLLGALLGLEILTVPVTTGSVEAWPFFAVLTAGAVSLAVGIWRRQ